MPGMSSSLSWLRSDTAAIHDVKAPSSSWRTGFWSSSSKATCTSSAILLLEAAASTTDWRRRIDW
eukprot:8318128-Pyramimonas_sp.AAC.1